jgi:HisJ family histidinol phosphate phosphatase
MNDAASLSADPRRDPRLPAVPDVHGHAKGEHRPYAEERPIPYTARMLFLWFYHACLRGSPRFMMVSDHINFLTFEDPAAINLVRRALKLAEAGDLYGASETAGVDLAHAAVVSEGLRRGMRFSIGAEVDVDPRSRPDALNIVEALRPDAVIRSVHFLTIEHPEHGPDWQWPFDNPEFISLFERIGVEKTWEIYIDTVVDAIEKLPGQILGHFYAPAKFGHWPDDATLQAYEDRVLDVCAQRGTAVEINTRLFYRSEDEELKRKYREVNLRLMRKAKTKEIGICISSDAHSPKDQGGGFEEALAMLDEADVNELVFPINGRMARVALRATKEHLEQKAGRALAAPQNESIGGSGASVALAQAPAQAPPAVAETKPAASNGSTTTDAAESSSKEIKPPKAPPRKRPSRAKIPTDANVSAKAPAAAKTPAVKPEKPISAKKPSASKEPVKAKKAPVKTAVKPAAKKPPAKKAPAKKAPVKKAAAKKAPAKKAPPKKTPAKKKSGKPRR